MALGADIDVELVARLFLRFLDLSRDVERNRADTAATEENGMVYVFDAGLAEIFLNPRDARGWSASLHTRDWHIGPKMPDVWRSYAAQTALATADYLFGGALPGQRGGRIWMSLWHRKELVRRLDQAETRQAANLKELGREGPALDRATSRFDGPRSIAEGFIRIGGLTDHVPVDSLLKADIERYLSFAKPVEIEATLFTRLALGTLVNDRHIEPAEQLQRLVTRPLRDRIATLETSLRIDKPDLERMTADARHWYRALAEECNRHGIKIIEDGADRPQDDRGEEVTRHAAALWDDARTLALVSWASVQRRSEARIVLVTADTILFDAYRRWYVDLRLDDPAYAHPFCLRRLRQYAPSLNLIDSGLVQGERFRQLFREIDDILETMLLPLNLSVRQTKAGEQVVERMRESTALRSMDRKPIATDDSYRGLIVAIDKTELPILSGQLATLMDRWREFERAALGQAETEVHRRVRSHNEFFANLSSDPSARAKAFERYAANIVGRIADGSRAVSENLARDVIDDWRGPGNAHGVRAPLALRLIVTLGGQQVDIGAKLMAKLEPGAEIDGTRTPLIEHQHWADLYAKPPLMFAIATALSIAAGDWTDAEDFAERSLKADPAISDTYGPAVATEIVYLAALAKRFHIGDIGSAVTEAASNRIIGLHRDALELNDRCVTIQLRERQAPTLRELRSYSERAAARLFYVAARNPRVIQLATIDPPARNMRTPDAEYEIDRAEDDLRLCFSIDRIEVSADDEARTRFKARLRRQIYTNAAASYLLRRLWGLDAPRESLFSPYNKAASQRAYDADLQNRGDSVMAFEVLAFRAFIGDHAARRALPSFRLPATRSLRLDSHLVSAIKDLIRTEPPLT